MKVLVSALLYTAVAFGAITSSAHADMSKVAELAVGDMKKLRFHEEPREVSDVPFQSETGEEMTLADYQGQITVLNFWATWCAPCRTEMPHLSALQTHFADQPVEIVTIATGRNAPAAMKAFFDEIGVDNLPLHTDAKQKLARDMAVLGLPITVVMNAEGQEIARMQGDADWSSDSAIAMLTALLPDS
jgi:thiol-disulfide isomerase/thioredoxin